MSVPWIRMPAGRREHTAALLAAGAAAVGVGVATFYVVRLILSRERVEIPGSDETRGTLPEGTPRDEVGA